MSNEPVDVTDEQVERARTEQVKQTERKVERTATEGTEAGQVDDTDEGKSARGRGKAR